MVERLHGIFGQPGGLLNGCKVKGVFADDLRELLRFIERCAGLRRSQHGFAAVEVDQLRAVLTNDGKARRSGFRTDCIAGNVAAVAAACSCQCGGSSGGDFGEYGLNTGEHPLCAIHKALNGDLCAFLGLITEVHVCHAVGHVLRNLVHGVAHAGF